jgi:chemotaxis protein methyltransferase CheR
VPGEPEELADDQVQPLLDALRGFAGITIPIRKKTMVLFRLRRRFAELRHPGLDAYLANLRHDKKEQQTFINLLTTNETAFFRTRRVWEFFRNEWLPGFHAANPSAPHRAWSAAASTGEEACSIAMSCLDFQLQHPSFRFQVLATDIDTEVLARAESGCFRAVTVNRLRESHPSLFNRHFIPASSGEWRIDPATLRTIRFATHNLMSSPRAFLPQDAVFLRNVLIYFREAEQSQIINGIADFMLPGSILILGESESLSGIQAPFDFVQPQIYRRIA